MSQVTSIAAASETLLAETVQRLSSKPWNADLSAMPRELILPRGMLGEEERRMLFWLARHHYRGEGAIVDAGAYIGSSAYCLASGLSHAGVPLSAGPLIHSYDYFAAFDDYVAEAITTSLRPTTSGESYLDVFEWQTGQYRELIKSYPGDFQQHRWDGSPIEILFIDIAKTRELNSHLVHEFFPRLIPGRSVVIQQDFYHCWHPYLHITMEFLGEYFEMVDGYVEWQSRVYLLKKPIPASAIAEMVAYAFTLDERLAMLDGLIARESGDMKVMMELTRLWEIARDNAFDRFEQDYRAFRARHAAGIAPSCEAQAIAQRDYVARMTGRQLD